MEQFSLEKYLKNPDRKIVTYDGRNVRIICVNRISDDYPVVALIRNKDKEVIECYTKDGKYIKNKIYNHDLFFATEKKEGWVNLYNSCEGTVGRRVYGSEKEAKSEIDRDKLYISTIKIEWEE